MNIQPAMNLYNPGRRMGMADVDGLILDHSVHSRGGLAQNWWGYRPRSFYLQGLIHDRSVHSRGALGNPVSWLSMVPTVESGMRMISEINDNGMGQGIDFTSIINRGIDVVGSILNRPSTPYISPDDPRFKQTPQNVYMYPPPMPGYVPPPGVPSPTGAQPSGVGFQVSQNTLLLMAGAVLIFLVARK